MELELGPVALTVKANGVPTTPDMEAVEIDGGRGVGVVADPPKEVTRLATLGVPSPVGMS
jgi:hypothetical protein